MTAFRASDRNERIRDVLREHARLATDVDTLDDQADLYQAGMTSHASVNLMLALEDAFDVEFPDSMLTRSVFQSVSAIADAIRQLQPSAS
jgi:acyl carrier protein